MIINHNMQAINAHRQMGSNAVNSQKSMEKLSSGLRINRAGDDAAGLAISEKMRGQIRGLDQAQRNAQDGISLIQTAEGALTETHSILQRMRELSVQSANDTNTNDDRAELQKEIKQLSAEIDRIGNNTEFNTQKLLNGDKANTGVTVVTKGDDGTITGGTPGTVAPAGTKMTAGGANTGTGDVTIEGTFTGTANETLTLKKTGTGWSVDGGTSDVTVTTGKIDYKGMTIDIGALTGSATDDEYTFALTAPVGGTPTGQQAGKYTFELGKGDIKIDGVTIAKADTADTAKLQAALDAAGAATAGKYTATVVDGKVTLEQTAGNESATEPTVEGAKDNSISLQVGANSNQTIEVTIGDMRAEALKGTVKDGENKDVEMSVADVDVSTREGAQLATQALDNAIKSVSAQRSQLGAVQNRLEHTINNLGASSENLTAAESRIRDVDMAKEMMNFTKNNVLNQAAQAMLAQANQQPNQVLQLLR